MSDFDVGRIVPATRDLFGAIAMRRRGLALLPTVTGPEDRVAAEVARLDGIDVRGLTCSDVGPIMQRAAQSSASLPMLSLTTITSVEAAQRARFHGADGVCVPAASLELAKGAQSMRMLTLAAVASVAEAVALRDQGERAFFTEGDRDAVAAIAKVLPAPALLVAAVSDLDVTAIRGLVGVVDALAVPSSVHAADGFEDLLDEVD